MKARAAGLAGASARQASAMRPRSLGRVSVINRTVAYSIASALSATLLVLSIPRGHHLPTDAGYSTAALTSTIVLIVALATSLLFALPGNRPGRVRVVSGG